jgi:hypothetical protein
LKQAAAAAIPANLSPSSDHQPAAPAFNSLTVSVAMASQFTVLAESSGAINSALTTRLGASLLAFGYRLNMDETSLQFTLLYVIEWATGLASVCHTRFQRCRHGLQRASLR